MKLCEILTSQDVAGILANFLKKSLDEKWRISSNTSTYSSGNSLLDVSKNIGGTELEFVVVVQRRGTVFEIYTYYQGSSSCVREKTVHQVLQHILDVASDPHGWSLDNAPGADK